MSGRSVAQAITFALTPVISRLYLPEHFGMAAVFVSVMVVLGPLSCFSYEKAVTLARSLADAKKLLVLCFFVAVAMAVVAPPIVATLSLVEVLPAGLLALGPLFWVLPIAIVLDGCLSAASAWILRHRQYKNLAAGEIAQTGTRSGFRVLAGFAFGSTVTALILSYVVAQAVKLAVIVRVISRKVPTGPLFSEKAVIDALPQIARGYSDFPRYNMATGFMMQLTAQLPVFVLGATFGPQVAGFFAMADRVMRSPINNTSNTLRQVVLQKLSQIWNAERPIRSQLARTVSVLVLLGTVPFFVFWTYGEELLGFVLGQRWQTAGRYIEILAPYFMVAFLGAPFNAAMSAMRKQRLWFWLEMCTAGARLTIIPVAAMQGATPETVLRAYVLATVCTKLASMAIVFFTVPRVHPGFPEETRS